jgi:hypothetical protein
MEQDDLKPLNLKDLLGNYQSEFFTAGITVIFILLLFLGGVLATGVVLGLLTAISTSFLVIKAKEGAPRFYNWVLDHPYPTIVLATVLFTGLFGTTATGLIAGGVFGVTKVVLLNLASKYCEKADVSATPTIVDDIKGFIVKKGGKGNVDKPIVIRTIHDSSVDHAA